jgi:hypothetical protein
LLCLPDKILEPDLSWQYSKHQQAKSQASRHVDKVSSLARQAARIPGCPQAGLPQEQWLKRSRLGCFILQTNMTLSKCCQERENHQQFKLYSRMLFRLFDCRHLARWGGGTQNCYPRLTVCQVTEARGATLDISQRHVEDAYHPGFSVCCDAEEAFVSFGCATVERNEKLLPQLLIVRRIPERLPSCPCKHICVPWEVLLSYNENLSKVIMGTAPHCPSGRCPAGCATQ